MGLGLKVYLPAWIFNESLENFDTDIRAVTSLVGIKFGIDAMKNAVLSSKTNLTTDVIKFPKLCLHVV